MNRRDAVLHGVLKHGGPLSLAAKMMQHRGRQDNVESLSAEIHIADIGLDCFDFPSARLDRSRTRTMEHRLTEIEQRYVQGW